MLFDLVNIEKSKTEIPFKKRVALTLVVIGLFCVMAEIMPIGFSRILFPYIYPSIPTLFVGFPSVASFALPSIVLTWCIALLAYEFLNLVGTNINLRESKNKVYFRVFQYLSTFFISFLVTLALGFLFRLSPSKNMLILGGIQIAIASILVMLMIEILSKYGLGTGIGLFIITYISSWILETLLNPLRILGISPIGIIPNLLERISHEGYDFSVLSLLSPILNTIIAFCLSIGFLILILFLIRQESEKFENENGISYPLKLLYASNVSLLITFTFLNFILIISYFFLKIDDTKTNPIYYLITPPLCAIFNLLFAKFWIETCYSDTTKTQNLIKRHTWQILSVGFLIGSLTIIIELIKPIGTAVGVMLVTSSLYLLYEKIKNYQNRSTFSNLITTFSLACVIGTLGFFICIFSQIIREL